MQLDFINFIFFESSCSFIFLFLENYGVRKLEALFAVLIAVMAISFAWMFGETKPNMKELLVGEQSQFKTKIFNNLQFNP